MVSAKPRALIFDAYGTLLDVHTVILRAGSGIEGDMEALSRLWRQKQVEATWLRALMERYVDFWHVTEEALRSAVRQLAIAATDAQIHRLMQSYRSPAAFAEVREALEACRGIPMAILSNGTPEMLESAVRANGLESCFTEIISVERVKTYKPSPRVYALGPEVLKVPASETVFVSANAWDAAGAKAFGYRVCWCNRTHLPVDVGEFAPDYTVPDLRQIATL